MTLDEYMGRKVETTAQPYLSVCVARKHLSEPAVRSNPSHVCSPQPLPSPPPQPEEVLVVVGRGGGVWGGLRVKTVRVFSHVQRLVLLCQPTKCGSRGGGWGLS